MATKMQKTRGECIQELHNLVTNADLNFRIWWIYVNREDLAKYINTLNAYALFFTLGKAAHFTAMIGAVSALYETRRDTVNVARVLKMFPSEVAESVRDKRDEATRIWRKAYRIAKSILHHVSLEEDSDKVFAQAGLSPDEIKRLISVSKEIVDTLSYANDRSTFASFLDSSKQTYRLLDRLLKNGPSAAREQ